MLTLSVYVLQKGRSAQACGATSRAFTWLHLTQHAQRAQGNKPKTHPDSEQLQAVLQTLVIPTYHHYRTLQAWCAQPKPGIILLIQIAVYEAQGIAPEWSRFTDCNLSPPGLTQLSLKQGPTVHHLHLIGLLIFDELSWRFIQGQLFELQPSLAI